MISQYDILSYAITGVLSKIEKYDSRIDTLESGGMEAKYTRQRRQECLRIIDELNMRKTRASKAIAITL